MWCKMFYPASRLFWNLIEKMVIGSRLKGFRRLCSCLTDKFININVARLSIKLGIFSLSYSSLSRLLLSDDAGAGE